MKLLAPSGVFLLRSIRTARHSSQRRGWSGFPSQAGLSGPGSFKSPYLPTGVLFILQFAEITFKPPRNDAESLVNAAPGGRGKKRYGDG